MLDIQVVRLAILPRQVLARPDVHRKVESPAGYIFNFFKSYCIKFSDNADIFLRVGEYQAGGLVHVADNREVGVAREEKFSLLF